MTIADRLREEGHWQGVQQGVQQGKQQEALRIAATMLEKGIEDDLIQAITGLSAEELATLRH